MEKIRLLLRSVYLKGYQDALTKTADMSWEDKIINDIRTLLKAKIPAKEQTQATHTGAWYETEWDEGFNNCVSEMQKVIDSL